MPSLERKSLEDREEILLNIVKEAVLGAVNATEVAKGHDSHVFRCVFGDGACRALKIYGYEYLGRDQAITCFQLNEGALYNYFLATNALSTHLKENPLIRSLSSGKRIRFEVAPIDSVGRWGDFVYTTSKFQKHEDAYDLLVPERNYLDRAPEISIPSSDASSLHSIDAKTIGELIEFLGIDNPFLEEPAPIDEISQTINTMLQTSGVHLESGNMRLHYDAEKDEFVMVITDIGSKVMDIALVHEPLDRVLEVMNSLR